MSERRLYRAVFDRIGPNDDIPPYLFTASGTKEVTAALRGFAQRYLPGRAVAVDVDGARSYASVHQGGDLLGTCTIVPPPAAHRRPPGRGCCWARCGPPPAPRPRHSISRWRPSPAPYCLT